MYEVAQEPQFGLGSRTPNQEISVMTLQAAKKPHTTHSEQFLKPPRTEYPLAERADGPGGNSHDENEVELWRHRFMNAAYVDSFAQ
jgi:hypothetical protein